MASIHEILPKVWYVKLEKFEDVRGSFIKTYTPNLYHRYLREFEIREEFYTVSKKNVIRGMHFQLPPDDHEKVVFCSAGSARDVMLDLRPGKGYGKFVDIHLSGEEPGLLFMPKGIAHGYRALEDNTNMVYKTSSEYAPESDTGILWNSFGYDWGPAVPILSDRDQFLSSFEDFKTPFKNL
jgi:dTDP-4-dehydrorhamnose 3,5-epimerase/CDP-3, 6-dideoxy-D-glycero-D-glycero-4-hexulose-5-epimerase